MGVKISVVVPVFNGADYLGECAESVLTQTMPRGDYELVFVDDGSTDETPQLLAALAEREQAVRAVHHPPSGGPGAPRNAGVEQAAGEYVYFLDQDDRLAPRALERMYAMATRCDSDIVLGKVVGHGRGVARNTFAASRDHADILDDHLLGFLTPHKLFRRSFLLQHDLRFPEGPAWLEDHRLVVEAYFRARTISVLADDVCCHWLKRPGRAHHSARRFDPVAYYQALREVLDIVDAHTLPGAERDRMYAHWYHGKMLRLMTWPVLLGRPVPYSRYRWYREIHRLVRERFPTPVDAWLPLSMRVRSWLLRRNAYADIARLAAAERGLTVAADLEQVGWDGDALEVRARGRLTYADGRPVTFRRAGDRLLWNPPCDLRTALPDEAFDVSGLIGDSRLELVVQNRDDKGAYSVPTRSELTLDADGDALRVRLVGTARIDPATGKLGRPLDAGTWDLLVRADSCGWGPQRRLGGSAEFPSGKPPVDSTRTFDGEGGTFVARPYWTGLGNLSVQVRN
ncbi:Glycosyltransferase involved in cell wall bisynthesis [Actinopolymorpha cephalotaxi]|uniref:Glycosyltransferase involved in cell wall biosynthesis n=1 Tax=Actinopolymorpha cephalotaxi TaxID=504797 RepID=A0A1I2VLA7_9ACTN|nr:glycosyltransferase family A protein [Actinopolymorpha cephalotaxi]NYH83274.1 glycosyltransferase involved in cell wall biosynthesis [Actinopolymorpha cephalotaxi]SFG89952.1 Glycosyltransferase involved in cell wall bisynthesis [Actinopolymorpha cephalotaxi]